jgi:hypothetical protein
MSYETLKLTLQQLQSELNRNNYREIKPSLIDIQQKIGEISCSPSHKEELESLTQSIFEIIKQMQAEDRKLFEEEAAQNYAELKQAVIEAIDFTQKNIDKHEEVWQVLIETQQLFKGKKFIAEQREQLFGTLQKLFEILKKRKGESVEERQMLSGKKFSKPEDQVEYAVSQCKHGNIDQTWAIMLHTKDVIMNEKLHPDHRKKMIEKIQQGFDILKTRREAIQKQQAAETSDNAEVIRNMIENAREEIHSNEDFKAKWEMLITIQNEFKSRKLEKEIRNELYDELQLLFKQLKTEQYDDHSDFEKQADDNFRYLNNLVNECVKEAQSNKDLKRTKAYLIKVQADFKGRKMRSFEREKLFAKLQTAFTTLNSRIEEHNRTQAEEKASVSKRQQELEAKINQLEQGLEKDQQELEKYEGFFREVPAGKETSENLQKKIDSLHSAMALKNAQLKIFYQEVEKLGKNKDFAESV